MFNGNILTKEQYFEERADRLGACALDRTGLYDANIRQGEQEGIFAVKELVQVTDINKDGDDFRLTMLSHTTGVTIAGRMTSNGIVYQEDAPEKCYLIAPPMNDLDLEFDEVCKELLEPIPLYVERPEPLKHTRHLEAPLPYPDAA